MGDIRRATVRQPHSDDKTVTKKITVRGSLLARALEQARKEGHHNLSLLIGKALNLYLTVVSGKGKDDQEAA